MLKKLIFSQLFFITWKESVLFMDKNTDTELFPLIFLLFTICHLQPLVKLVNAGEDKYGISYMWNLKYDTNERVDKTETDSQMYRNEVCLPKEKIG